MSSDNSVENSKIELLLRQTCFIIKRKGREILEDYNITPPQFNALQIIIHNGELTIGELSNKLYLAPSTITDLVDRMEKTELVERIRDTKDRRVVKVKALEKGNHLIDQVVEKRINFIEENTSDLSIYEKREFIKHLELLLKSSEQSCCK